MEIDPNDVVFDIGAYAGAFSLAVANEASKVYAIEPSSENYNCLCKNTAEYDNIERIQKVLLNKEGSVELKLGRDSTDHSVIDIDGEETNKIEYIDGTRLDNLSQELDINEIDFLKLDAEGAEPEVLEGAQNVTVRKVAVDCGAERQGEKTSAEIKKLLQNRGYTVQSKNSIVFGRI